MAIEAVTFLFLRLAKIFFINSRIGQNFLRQITII
jgi:hypothetical protein